MKITHGSGNNKKVYKSRVEYFATSLLLFNSGSAGESFDIINRGIEEDGKVALPFEFTFPSAVIKAPPAWFKPRHGFEHEAGHPLPTSLFYDENRVEYLLKVFVYKKIEWSPDETIALTLPFRPTPLPTSTATLVQFPKSNEFVIKGHQLNPDNDQDPGVLTKLKWSTLSKYQHNVPQAWFRLEAKCPYRLVAGKRIPITISLTSISRTPDIPDVPVITVQRVHVKLTSVLVARVPYSGFTGERDEFKDFPKEVLNKEYHGNGKILWDGMDIAEFGTLVLPVTILPSFASYGLRLVYRIRVIVVGECGGETFNRAALRDICEVVANVQRPERETDVAAPLPPAGPSTPGEALPVYEPAPDYFDAVSEGEGSGQQGDHASDRSTKSANFAS